MRKALWSYFKVGLCFHLAWCPAGWSWQLLVSSCGCSCPYEAASQPEYRWASRNPYTETEPLRVIHDSDNQEAFERKGEGLPELLDIVCNLLWRGQVVHMIHNFPTETKDRWVRLCSVWSYLLLCFVTRLLSERFSGAQNMGVLQFK